LGLFHTHPRVYAYGQITTFIIVPLQNLTINCFHYAEISVFIISLNKGLVQYFNGNIYYISCYPAQQKKLCMQNILCYNRLYINLVNK